MPKKAGVSEQLRRQVFRRGGFRCSRCGLQGREERAAGGYWRFPTDIPGVSLSVDHITPRARGGSSDVSNLRTLCTTCNAEKGTRADVAAIAAQLGPRCCSVPHDGLTHAEYLRVVLG